MLVCSLMFLELVFYAALAPLLPGLKHELGLSTSQAGVLVAMYALGSMVAAIPTTSIAARTGARTTALLGLLTFAVASVAFGLLNSYGELLGARFVQGMAGTACWTGAMVWLLGAAPAARRGEMLGFAFGIGEAGAIAGPLVGGLAAGVGRAPTFVAVAVFALALALATLRFPAPPIAVDSRLTLRPLLGSRRVRLIMWITVLPALLLAGISVLAPLQQDSLGSGPGLIAAMFGVAAALGMLLRPAVGRLSDRHGPVGPIRIGLLASFPVVFAIPWVANRWAAALLVIAALLMTGVMWAPLMMMLSDACLAIGVSQVMGVGIMNLVWSPANVLGSAGAGAIAQAAGQRWAYALMALPLLLAFVALSRRRGAATVAAAPGAARGVSTIFNASRRS